MTCHFIRSTKVIATLAIMLIATMFVRPAPALSGHRLGNGGDHVRATFLRMGQATLSYLQETDSGAAIVAAHDLDLAALEETLSIDVIEAVDGILIDNGGSVVDAIGEPGKIKLTSDRWLEHFEGERDVYFLVFHEMLRAVGIDD